MQTNFFFFLRFSFFCSGSASQSLSHFFSSPTAQRATRSRIKLLSLSETQSQCVPPLSSRAAPVVRRVSNALSPQQEDA